MLYETIIFGCKIGCKKKKSPKISDFCGEGGSLCEQSDFVGYEPWGSHPPSHRAKKRASGETLFFAEKEGFEPPEVLPSTVFKTAAIDHSATSPLGGAKLQPFFQLHKHFRHFFANTAFFLGAN